MITSNPEEYLNQLVAENALEEIKLGLDRVADVWHKLNLNSRPFIYIVGGTNGKGTCCALLERGLRCQGLSTGLICSPHLLSFNERVCINGEAASDEEWIVALNFIKAIKGATPLTYFEYCTLVAFVIFAKHEVDVWILEVGLGGRLDAVNIIDADCALLTSIGLDHTEILGDTREKIAYEKIAIARPDKYLVVGETQLPQNFSQLAKDVGANTLLINRDFGLKNGTITDKSLNIEGDTFYAHKPTGTDRYINLSDYEQPMLTSNLATAWQALNVYESPNKFADDATTDLISMTWQEFTLAGRWQKLAIGKNKCLIMDSGHNPAAAEVLARMLEQEITSGKGSIASSKKVTAIFSMLSNKDWLGFMQPLLPFVDVWHIFPLETTKGLGLEEMRQSILDLGILSEDKLGLHQNAAQIIEELLLTDDNPGNDISNYSGNYSDYTNASKEIFFVCGSFHTVGEIITQLKSHNLI